MKTVYTLAAVLMATTVLADNDDRSPAALEIREILSAAGYTMVRDVELDDGLWEAEVKDDGGRWHDLHVVPGSNEILDANSGKTILSAEEILSRLKAEGYTQVRDLDLDDAVWDVDATAPDGSNVDLRLNGFDGSILVSEIDD